MAARWLDVVDPPHEFVWETVGPPLMRDASLWRVRLDPVEGGTRIRQEFRILSMARGPTAWSPRRSPPTATAPPPSRPTSDGWARSAQVGVEPVEGALPGLGGVVGVVVEAVAPSLG